MVTVRRRVDRIPFAPVVALMFGLGVAVLVAAAPGALFERAVTATGVPQLVSFARPPLGVTARLIAVVLAFVVVSGLFWLALLPVERWLDRDRRRRTPWRDEGYASIDLADGDPVAARRAPIFAPRELGAPLMSDEALATASGLEPDPLLDAPVTDAELAVRPTSDPEPWVPTTSPDGETSIHALIRRLEEGLARRGGGRDPDPGAMAAPPLDLSTDWALGDAGAPTRQDPESRYDFRALRALAWR